MRVQAGLLLSRHGNCGGMESIAMCDGGYRPRIQQNLTHFIKQDRIGATCLQHAKGVNIRVVFVGRGETVLILVAMPRLMQHHIFKQRLFQLFRIILEFEIDAIKAYCKHHGVEAFRCTHWAEGGAGAEALARHVAGLADKGVSQFQPIYNEELSLWDKVKTIAREIYRADDIVADKSVRDQLKTYEAQGYGKFPICMAKTQYSFSTDPNLKGAPINHVVPIREVRLSAGAEFIVVVCGDIMTMPGLPRVPSAEVIGLDARGQIAGLF